MIKDSVTSEEVPIGSFDLVKSLEICDKIKSSEYPPKAACAALKRRLTHKNPNVQLLGLMLTDVCVKNCGFKFVLEVASREFMDVVLSLARALVVTGGSYEVKVKALGLIQSWGVACKGKPELAYVSEMYESLKHEGVKFPPIDKADMAAAILETETAPDWRHSDVCNRCRTAFTTFNRKHHCRNCGNTYCNDCSTSRLALPHLGVTEAVRVCDTCNAKLKTKTDKEASPTYSSPAFLQGTSSSDVAQKEQKDLERAIAASLGQSATKPVEKKVSFKPADASDEEDADLKRAIEESLKESTRRNPTSGYPSSQNAYPTTSSAYPTSSSAYPTTSSAGDAYKQTSIVEPEPETISKTELDAILLFTESVERAEAEVTQKGIQVLYPPQLHQLYAQAHPLQAKLYSSLQECATKYKSLYEMNQDIGESVKSYDAFLQQRLVYSQQQQQQQQWSGSHVYQPGYNPNGGYGATYNPVVSQPYMPPNVPPATSYAIPPTAIPQVSQQQTYGQSQQGYPSGYSAEHQPQQQQQQQPPNVVQEAPLIEL